MECHERNKAAIFIFETIEDSLAIFQGELCVGDWGFDVWHHNASTESFSFDGEQRIQSQNFSEVGGPYLDKIENRIEDKRFIVRASPTPIC